MKKSKVRHLQSALIFHDVMGRIMMGNAKEVSSKGKVLVVDDERHCRSLYKDELEAVGYIVECNDGQSSILSAIEDFAPDVIVLDINLGFNISGLDLLQQIRNKYIDLPVILNTAYDSFQHDVKTISADYYVVKNIDLSELTDKIELAFYKKKECEIAERTDQVFTSKEEWLKNNLDYIRLILRNKIISLGVVPESNIEQIIAKAIPLFNYEYAKAEGTIEYKHIAENACTAVQLFMFMAINELKKLFDNKIFVTISDANNVVNSEYPSLLKHEIVNILYELEQCKFMNNCYRVSTNLLHTAHKVKKGDYSGNHVASLDPISTQFKHYHFGLADVVLKDIRHDIVNVYNKLDSKLNSSSISTSEMSSVSLELKKMYWRLKSLSNLPLGIPREQLCLDDLLNNILDTEFLSKHNNIVKEFPFTKTQIDSSLLPLKIIFRNIVNNAIEASTSDGRILVSVVPLKSSVKVIIKDSGIGIDQKDLPHIFASGVSIGKQHHGGEGLHIVSVLSDALGITIDVESELGKGSTFTINIPTSLQVSGEP